MSPERRDPKDLLRPLAGPLIAALLTILVQLPYFRLWFAFMDEGHMVQFADIALRGGEFYRDATFYPLPGAFWLLAGAFKIFGASLLVSRWLVMIEFAIFVGIIFALLRRATDWRFAMIGVGAMWLYRIWAFPHWQIYSYSTTSLLVLLAALATLLVWLRSRDRRTLIAAGFLFGLGVLCKQDYGAAALLTVLIVMIVDARSAPLATRPGFPASLVWFILPASLVGAATGLYFWQVGVFEDLIRFTVTNHFVGMGSYEYMEFPSPWPLFSQDALLRTKPMLAGFLPAIAFTADWSSIHSNTLFVDTPLFEIGVKLFVYGPPIYLALSLARLVARRARLIEGAEQRIAWLTELTIAVFGTWLIVLVWVNRPQDYLHLAVLYWPLILLAILQGRASLGGTRRLRVAIGSLAVVLGLLLVPYSLRLIHLLRESHTELVQGSRGGVYVTPADYQMLTHVVDYVKANSGPDDKVAAIPYFPIINFLAERMAPHRSAYIIWPFPEVPDRDEQVVAALESTGTDLVIYHFTQFLGFNPFWEHAPKIFDYLVEHFEIDRVFSYDGWGYKLAGLKRQEESDLPGESLIPSGVSGLPLRVEGDGARRSVPPEMRDEYVREMAWPFTRVIALRPAPRGRRTVLSIPIRVPDAGGQLRSAVAVHPQWWFELPSTWVDFRVAIADGPRREVVFQKRLDPTMVLEDRGWFDVDVALDRWAGSAIEIELITEAQRAAGASIWLAGWQTPRLIER